MDYLVQRPPGAVLNRVRKFMVHRGFRMGPHFSDATVVFQRPFEQQRRVFGGGSVPGVQTVRFAAAATGEDHTRLTVSLSDQELLRELEHWITGELGGTARRAEEDSRPSRWRRLFGN